MVSARSSDSAPSGQLLSLHMFPVSQSVYVLGVWEHIHLYTRPGFEPGNFLPGVVVVVTFNVKERFGIYRLSCAFVRTGSSLIYFRCNFLIL